MINATVKRGAGYQRLEAYTIKNPDGQHRIPGRTVTVVPAHEEAPTWRAILAGFDDKGYAYVVPLSGHFGELRVRKLIAGGSGDVSLGVAFHDLHHVSDECDWVEAKALALSVALAFGLEGRA